LGGDFGWRGRPCRAEFGRFWRGGRGDWGRHIGAEVNACRQLRAIEDLDEAVGVELPRPFDFFVDQSAEIKSPLKPSP